MSRWWRIVFSAILISIIWRPVPVGAQTPSYVVELSKSDTVPHNSIAGERGLHIIFPCNKTYFDYRQRNWIELSHALDSIFSDSTLNLAAIHAYGAASPEGPYWNNVRLAKGRLKRVCDALRDSFPQLDSVPLSSYSVPEDYVRLAYVTREDSLYRDIERYFGVTDAETKANLQSDRAVWNDLLKRYYPGLRAVNVVLYVRKTGRPLQVLPPIAVEVPLLPTQLPEIVSPIISVTHTYCRRPPMVRLKTNLLYDAAAVPNVSIEFLPKSGHVTPEAKVLRAWWRNDSRFKALIVYAYEAGCRYYFRPDVHTGWFVSAGAGCGVYDVQTSKNHGRLSKKYLCNNKFEVGAGYVMPLGNSGWTLEFAAGVGCIYSRFCKYHGAEDWATPGEFYYDWHDRPEDYRKYTHRFRWAGPVNVGISVSYDIIYYKKKCVANYMTY